MLDWWFQALDIGSGLTEKKIFFTHNFSCNFISKLYFKWLITFFENFEKLMDIYFVFLKYYEPNDGQTSYLTY